MNIRLFFTLVFLGFAGLQLLPAQDNLFITEFLAENDRGLRDEDGEEQDWIEIYNAGTNTVNLDGWYLTDVQSNPTRWRFPATNLLANRYLIVFASNKNRRIAGQPLHTNFRLAREGEYLALVKPDGVTIASQYAPFQEQVADISYGLAVIQTIIPLISANAPSKYYVPTNDTLGSNWTAVAFNDSTWGSATGGVGYETEPPFSVIVADSATEFSGVQGQDNWFYGYYNKSIDVPATYQASNFVAFPGIAGPYGPENYFNGTAWDWYAGNPPWTEIGRTNGHPSGSNSGVEHWAIRRWISDVTGTLRVDWFLRKANTAGNGVTGRIYHNNTQRDTAVVAGNNMTGTNRTVNIVNVQVGDTIDIALDATGTDGQPTDSSDASFYGARISILPSYTNQFTTSIASQMAGVNPGAFIRIPFTVTNASALEFLTLRMKYDDGFAAYLNGEHLVSRNAPIDVLWNSTSTDSRNNVDALAFEDIDITAALPLITQGQNVLAIHGLNSAANDPDFLAVAELRGATLSLDTNTARYFTVPTPGAPNGAGNTNLGPLVFDAGHTPNEPRDNENVLVTVATRMTFRPVGNVYLTYRIMFSNEVTIPMFDDGVHGDGPPNDGTYGASIPAAASGIGQMVRWFVRAYDTVSNFTRLPAYASPTGSPQYFGTVVHNPNLTNPLPVLHMFIPDATLANAGNDSIGRYAASIYYLGEFYDNIGMNRHGQSSAGFPRRSYDLDFNPGNNFRYDPTQDRVDDINMLTTYPDKAKMRNMLSYGIYKDAGSAYHFVYPIRVQHNGGYYADYHLVENGDENFLKRLGLDDRGALYKMYNTFDSPALGVNVNAEKKTRKEEGNEDLVGLWNGAQNATYLWDNMDVPGTMNFLAARILTGDVDCCHKNYYLYRDSEGSGEWTGLPWDVDLSFGRNWNGTSQYWDDTMYPNNGLNVGGNNRLFGTMLNNAQMRQIYLRRIRTLMDELLQPPNTPPEQRRFEAQIDYWRSLIAPDAELEKTRWPTWGGTAATPAANAIISTCCTQSVAHASDIIKTNYLPARRAYMFGLSPGTLPNAQPSNAVVRIASVEYNPSTANQAQEYIQFLNTNTYAVDMSFWSVTGAISYTFKGGVVIPANSSLYLSPNVVAFRARTTGPRGGQSLFVQGNYDGQLSARGETLYLVDRGGRVVNTNAYQGNPSGPQQYLRITEIMYHPPAPPVGSTFDNEEFEYIELKNIGPTNLNLAGVHFKEGVEFAFPTNTATTLGPGQTMLLVKNLAAFTSRYGSGHNIGGVYTGTLDNSGEEIRLDDIVNEKILEFRYENNWYPSTDGMGFSLVIVNENAPYYTWNSKPAWRPSGVDGGSPGGSDTPLPTVATILVNEVFSHSDVPDVDFIELYNPNPTAVNISGWFISDDFAAPKKYRITNGVTIPAGGYIVFDETQFNANTNTGFSFGSTGDEAYIFSGDGTNLTGFFHGYEFGAVFTGESLGRHYTSTGGVHFVRLNTRTPGATNALPKVGPVVISEIMYHPPDRPGGVDDDEMEFIELRNVTGAAISLFEHNTGWRIRGGVDFDFPATASIPANGYAVVVSFHPLDTARASAFRTRYNLATSVPLYGPWSGKLDNSADRVELQRPDAPDGNDIPFVLLEQVEYADLPPWPQLADGIGPSLQRLDVTTYADDYVNWTAVVPSPNAPYPGGTMPTITTQPANQVGVAGRDVTFTVQAAGTPPLAYQWFHGADQIFGATSASLQLTSLRPNDAGNYSVIVFNGAGFVRSSDATLTVLIPASITRQPVNVVMRGSNAPGIYGHTFSNATFTVEAASSTPISYQWLWNGQPLSGATSRTLVIRDVTLTHAGTYACVVTDSVGSITSEPAQLIVNVPPLIVQQPRSQIAYAGQTVTLDIGVTGTEPMFYRWRRNGVAVNPQPNGPTYTLVNVQTNQSGQFTVVVTNAGFFTPGALSAAANLIVFDADRDGDGAPDVWETANGFNPDQASDGDGDVDGDGMLNADEFVAGTNPRDPESYLWLDLTPGRTNALEFPAVSNRTYTVQFSDDIASETWSNLFNAVSRPTNRLERANDTNAVPKRYYRVVTPFPE